VNQGGQDGQRRSNDNQSGQKCRETASRSPVGGIRDHILRASLKRCRPACGCPLKIQPMKARSWGEDVLSQERRVIHPHEVTPTMPSAAGSLRLFHVDATRAAAASVCSRWLDSYVVDAWRSWWWCTWCALVHDTIEVKVRCALERGLFTLIGGLTSGLR
jgi:hypothetical protein